MLAYPQMQPLVVELRPQLWVPITYCRDNLHPLCLLNRTWGAVISLPLFIQFTDHLGYPEISSLICVSSNLISVFNPNSPKWVHSSQYIDIWYTSDISYAWEIWHIHTAYEEPHGLVKKKKNLRQKEQKNQKEKESHKDHLLFVTIHMMYLEKESLQWWKTRFMVA